MQVWRNIFYEQPHHITIIPMHYLGILYIFSLLSNRAAVTVYKLEFGKLGNKFLKFSTSSVFFQESKMTTREASHAGSWYTDSSKLPAFTILFKLSNYSSQSFGLVVPSFCAILVKFFFMLILD